MDGRNIILTGFMGTGKSSLGRLLARAIGYRFVDTDHKIEERYGLSIRQIFATQGEATFRKLETELVRELAGETGLVIATGGGLVLNPENVALLQQNGRIFCLSAPADKILERISLQPGKRPLLDEPNPRQRINELLTQRQAAYSQFEQLSTANDDPQKILRGLLARLRQNS